MKYKIKFPNENKHTGKYFGIVFVEGTGETDNKSLADKLEYKGLEVEETPETQEKAKGTKKTNKE